MTAIETQVYQDDLDASALEERPDKHGAASSSDNAEAVVHEENEEENVAYDEEPDEAEAEAAAPSTDEQDKQELAATATQGHGSPENSATSGPDSATIDPETTLRADGSQADEWELSSIPDEWRPAPLFKVKNIPVSDSVDEQKIQEVLENAGLSVKSVAFDSVKVLDKRVAYVRLKPPGTSAATAANKSKLETDVSQLAMTVVKQLRESDPPLQIGEDKLTFDTSHPQVQLFIGNITEEWSSDASLRAKMEDYGPLERCMVMRNHKGQNKGYAFVEYSVPNGALKCKEGMDKIEADMRPDFRRKESLTIQANGRWQQIKLLRAEWAHPRAVPGLYSTVLYITNLAPGFCDTAALRQRFEKFGPVTECHLPRNKQTGNSKGFAFVKFSQSIFADAAYRIVDETDQEFMGSKLVVSFANPAKNYDAHVVRPQLHNNSGFNGVGNNRLAGQGSPVGNALAQRTALNANKAGFSGRVSPSQGFAGNFSQQLSMPGMGFGNDEMAVRMQQQALQMQQQMRVQYQQQMQMTVQQQLRAQQALMQAQLRAAQAQIQQYQEQALQYKSQASRAQLEAQQETEARKRAEAEAQASLQSFMAAKQSSNYGAARSDSGYGLNPAAFAAFGNQAGYQSAMAGSGQDGAMYANAMYSQGFSSGSQGWPSAGSVGHTGSTGAGGQDASGFSAAVNGQQGGYSMPQEGLGQAGSYPQQAAFAAFSPQQSGMAASQAGYSNMGYGGHNASNGGYGAAFSQAGAGFGQAGSGMQAGQKRDSQYDQASMYGGYGGYGSQGGQTGQDYKRQRY